MSIKMYKGEKACTVERAQIPAMQKVGWSLKKGPEESAEEKELKQKIADAEAKEAKEADEAAKKARQEAEGVPMKKEAADKEEKAKVDKAKAEEAKKEQAKKEPEETPAARAARLKKEREAGK